MTDDAMSERAYAARQQWMNQQPYLRDAKTKLQAEAAGEDTAHWPEPCDVCGALWKRTPAGRWIIDHGSHNGPAAAPELKKPRRTRREGDDD